MINFMFELLTSSQGGHFKSVTPTQNASQWFLIPDPDPDTLGWGSASFKFTPTPGVSACVYDIVCLKSTDVGDVVKFCLFFINSNRTVEVSLRYNIPIT